MRTPTAPSGKAAVVCTAVHPDHQQQCALGDHRGATHLIRLSTPNGHVPLWWLDTLARRPTR